MNQSTQKIFDGLLLVLKDNLIAQGGFSTFAGAIGMDGELHLFNFAAPSQDDDLPMAALEPLPRRDKNADVLNLWRDKTWPKVIKALSQAIGKDDYEVCGVCCPARVVFAKAPDRMYEAGYCHIEGADGTVFGAVVAIEQGPRGYKLGKPVMLPARPSLFPVKRRRA
ncbi:MAG: hypothetical protein ABSH20_06935 [Tepidisphaeraceae bacterium]|jgi:hypothetical protein